MSALCRSHVGAVLEKQKKKGHRRTPESGASSPFRCPTRVGHRHSAKNGMSMQPSSRCFCSWAIFTPTCPNSVLFQASSFVLHYSRHHTIEKFEVEDRPSLYASETTCSHFASPNHIDSKRNSFFFFPFSGLFRKCKSSGL